MIRLTTNFGTIDIELDYKNAPVTASNFEQYVKDGHYNGLIFHRVIPGFMIQGGGFKPGMDEVDTREPIKNEANNGLSNEKYTIAMYERSAFCQRSILHQRRRQQVPRLQERNNAGLGLCRIRQGCCRSGCC